MLMIVKFKKYRSLLLSGLHLKSMYFCMQLSLRTKLISTWWTSNSYSIKTGTVVAVSKWDYCWVFKKYKSLLLSGLHFKSMYFCMQPSLRTKLISTWWTSNSYSIKTGTVAAVSKWDFYWVFHLQLQLFQSDITVSFAITMDEPENRLLFHF